MWKGAPIHRHFIWMAITVFRVCHSGSMLRLWLVHSFMLALLLVRRRFANLQLRWPNGSARQFDTILEPSRDELAAWSFVICLSKNVACGTRAVCSITMNHLLRVWLELFPQPTSTIFPRQFVFIEGFDYCCYGLKLCNVNESQQNTDKQGAIKRGTHGTRKLNSCYNCTDVTGNIQLGVWVPKPHKLQNLWYLWHGRFSTISRIKLDHHFFVLADYGTCKPKRKMIVQHRDEVVACPAILLHVLDRVTGGT